MDPTEQRIYDEQQAVTAELLETQKGRQIVVHKEGQEGTLLVDAFMGKIYTPIAEQPAWAEGLATAAVQERLHYYQTRLGKDSPELQGILKATAVNADDLSWLGLDAEQAPITVDALDEFRMGTIAKALDITAEGDIVGATAEREVSAENRGRSQAEIEAIELAQLEGFGGANALSQADKARSTGTQGR